MEPWSDQSACPPATVLRHFLLGSLSERESEPLERHLLHCVACWRALRELVDDDPLVAAVRQAPPVLDRLLAHDQVQDLMARLSRLRLPASEATVAPSGEFPVRTDTPAPKIDQEADATQEVYDFLAPPQQPGELGWLGGYRVLRLLGAGGMGIVFLAEDPRLGRQVALKVLRPVLAASPAAHRRFLREARVSAALRHDHIVTIHQVGEDRGLPFLTMEVLQGETLDQRLRREGRLPPAEVLRIGREVAQALAAAHQQGLVHRDVKPSNIWLEAGSGRAKLLDFGLAHDVAAALSHSGVIVGTPAYMAPEQAGGAAPQPCSDLFSLGCVLYHLCAGRPPYRGQDTFALLTALALEDPEPLGQVRPELPLPLTDLVMQLLARSPERRPASAQAVMEAIQAIESGTSRLPTPVPDPRREVRSEAVSPVRSEKATGRWAARWGAGTALLAGVLLLGMVLVLSLRPDLSGVSAPRTETGAGQPTPEPDPRAAAPAGPSPLDKLTPAAIPKAERYDWQPKELVAVLGEHRRRCWSSVASLAYRPDGRVLVCGTPNGVFLWDVTTGRLLTRGLPGEPVGAVAFDPAGTLLAVGAGDRGGLTLWDPDLRQQRLRLHGHTGAVTCLALSPHGALLASGSADQTVRLWETETGRPRAALAARHPVRCLAFSPDGRMVAAGDDGRPGTVTLWEVATSQPCLSFPVGTSGVKALAFAVGGNRLVTAGDDWFLRTWDLASAKELDIKGWWASCLALSPDGRTLALGIEDGTIRRWDPETGKERPALRGHTVPVRALAFSADGKTLASGDHGGGVRLWDLASGRERDPLRGHGCRVQSLAIAPDGGLLASGSLDGSLLLWEGATGQQRQALGGHQGWPGIRDLAFDPRSRLLASAGRGGLKVWQLDTGQVRIQLDSGYALAFRPDGRRLAAATDAPLHVLDLAAGRELNPLAGFAGHVSCLAYSPDGRTLAMGLGYADEPGEVKLWDMDTGRVQATLRGQGEGIQALAFAPSGRTLAASGGGAVTFWDVRTGAERARWRGHESPVVWGLAYSPDGQVLASAALDGQLILWDLARSGQQLRQWQMPGPLYGVAFAPDGRHLATANGNGTVYIMRLADRPGATR